MITYPATGGLFIGFTFFKAKDTQKGTQNKLFSIFMATILWYVKKNAEQHIFLIAMIVSPWQTKSKFLSFTYARSTRSERDQVECDYPSSLMQ